MPFIGKSPTAGFATIVKDTLTANGSTTQFTLSKQVASPTDIAVFVGNVRQEPTTAYTVNGTTLDFGSGNAPATGLDMYVLHIGGTQESSVVPADGTISSAKIQSNAVTSAKLDTNISVSGTLGVTGGLTTSAGIAIPSGQGIDFSASANASGMTSEILDDYEEGTWTPTPATGTFTGDVEGYYTKIGRLVHAHCHIQTTSTISSSSNFDIGGLPYAMSTDPDSISGSLMTRYLNVSGTDQSATSFMGSGSTIIRMYVQAVDATYVRVKHNDYNNANVGIRASIVYPTD